jgi:hypothetical protein
MDLEPDGHTTTISDQYAAISAPEVHDKSSDDEVISPPRRRGTGNLKDDRDYGTPDSNTLNARGQSNVVDNDLIDGETSPAANSQDLDEQDV